MSPVFHETDTGSISCTALQAVGFRAWLPLLLICIMKFPCWLLVTERYQHGTLLQVHHCHSS